MMQSESTMSFDAEQLSSLPCHVYWKNKKGIYLGYNSYGAARLGYHQNEIIGRSDFDIFPSTVAIGFWKNDQQIFGAKKQSFMPEDGVLKENTKVVFLSYKMPLFGGDEGVTGVLGLSFTRAPEKRCASTQLEHDFNYCPEVKHKKLSKMENACMRQLCSGLTMKQIARQLKVSPKTVETYIERVKIKFNCHNKAELMWIMVNELSVDNPFE